MRNFFLIFVLCQFWCNSQKLASDSNYYSDTITGKELMELLYVYSSDYFKGRGTGELGQKRACDFLRDYYKSNNIYPAKGTNNYYQPMELLINKKKIKTENVAAVIKGSHFPNEYVILSAHLDHLGTNDNGDVYNGADDDGSGTVALLEIAEAFKHAFDDGKGPKRSLVFLHFTGEEKGLLGSKFYTENPLYPLPSTIADLNIDMIGRINPKRNSNNPNYIYLIG